MVQEHNVDVRVRREFAPPISAEGDDRELPAVGDVAGLDAEFLFDRRAGYAFDQQVYNQTPRLNYLLSAHSEPVAQAQSLCLYFQEFFERGEPLRRIRLTLDLTQFLARVTLNCDQINLHLIMRRLRLRICKQGAKGRRTPAATLQRLYLLAFAAPRAPQWAAMNINRSRQKCSLGTANQHFCIDRVRTGCGHADGLKPGQHCGRPTTPGLACRGGVKGKNAEA
jgi:hypothetical protein